MCDTCGCGEPGSYRIRKAGEKVPEHLHSHAGEPEHHHDQDHEHDHPHDHDHHHGNGHDHHHDLDHSHMHGTVSGDQMAGKRIINVGKDILETNNLMAERNRGFFEAKKVYCINMVSSPGSGKTTILERTIAAFKEKIPVFVIEGDQQSMLDADRLAQLGIPVVQINTGSGCHLDAFMINNALKSFVISNGSLLFIENVGNLVCPALFDLGETDRVLIMSVTEGEDKPLKYPAMFRSAQLCLINKTDLLPYVDFNVEIAKEGAGAMNPALEFLPVSAKTGEGMEEWFEWLMHKINTTGN